MRLPRLVFPSARRLALALAAAACLQCTERLAGGSTEIGNTGQVTGKVLTLDGAAAVNARVSLIPEAFDPGAGDALPSAWTALTDSQGIYLINHAIPGTYAIEAADAAQRTRALLTGLVIDSGKAGPTIEPDTKLFEGGSISIPLSGVTPAGYVFLPGSSVWARIDSSALASGELILTGVPPGSYTRLLQALPGKQPENLLGRGIQVNSGEKLFLGPYHAWRKRRTITVNPGSAPLVALRNVPLLIRLDAGNFDFPSAQPAGGDIRFTRADGITPLPFEIEHWDGPNQRAEIWVLLDTLSSGNAAQPFLIYSGNPAAAPAGKGASVFDPGSGFTAAWHLGEDLKDATSLGNDGTNQGTQPIAGAIGIARAFDGTGAHVSIADAPGLHFGAGDFTLSAWVSPDSFDSTRQIFAKRDTLENYEIQISHDATVTAILDPKGNTSLYVSSKTALQKGNWYAIAFVRSGGMAYLYVNGALEAGPVALPTEASPKADLLIGDDPYFAGKEGFRGKIDEVEFSAVARSPEWLDFTYRNQKPDAQILTIAP